MEHGIRPDAISKAISGLVLNNEVAKASVLTGAVGAIRINSSGMLACDFIVAPASQDSDLTVTDVGFTADHVLLYIDKLVGPEAVVADFLTRFGDVATRSWLFFEIRGRTVGLTDTVLLSTGTAITAAGMTCVSRVLLRSPIASLADWQKSIEPHLEQPSVESKL